MNFIPWAGHLDKTTKPAAIINIATGFIDSGYVKRITAIL